MQGEMTDLPQSIDTEEQLDELLSRPGPAVVDALGRMRGDLMIVGGGGKIGLSLSMMALRAARLAGSGQKIIVVGRSWGGSRSQGLDQLGAELIACDLLDQDAVNSLPQAPNVIYLAGMKFGTTGSPHLTWAANALIPAYVARRLVRSRIVAFSTGCVYEFVDVNSRGSVETDPLTPPGEYANSCVARERVFEYFSATAGTPVLLLRLNYAVEMRYGVLADIATEVWNDRPVDVTMGYVNVIWQGDVNAATIRLLDHAASPAVPMNIAGPETLSVRQLAQEFGRMMGRTPRIVGKESPTALLSDSSRACGILGRPSVPVEQVMRWVAGWVQRGGRLLNKPTHFQTRDGKY